MRKKYSPAAEQALENHPSGSRKDGRIKRLMVLEEEYRRLGVVS
jgi:hypothetical protein